MNLREVVEVAKEIKKDFLEKERKYTVTAYKAKAAYSAEALQLLIEAVESVTKCEMCSKIVDISLPVCSYLCHCRRLDKREKLRKEPTDVQGGG